MYFPKQVPLHLLLELSQRDIYLQIVSNDGCLFCFLNWTPVIPKHFYLEA